MFGLWGKRKNIKINIGNDFEPSSSFPTFRETTWALTEPMTSYIFDDAARQREEELNRLNALSHRGQAAYQYIAQVACRICETSMASITLLDESSVWLQAGIGIKFDKLPLSQTFCSHVLASSPQVLVVSNAQIDERFSKMAIVRNFEDSSGIRFYAGAPIKTKRGVLIGVIAVADEKVRSISPIQVRTLKLLAEQTAKLLENKK